MKVQVLSGGAAQGLLGAIEPQFAARTGAGVAGTFSAVGAMRDRLVAGDPADLVILSAKLIGDLAGSGHVDGASVRDIGIVRTAIAVRSGDKVPDIGDTHALRAALLGADAFYTPDTERATAGIHVARMLAELGIADEMRSRLRVFPNGMTAMGEMAAQIGGTAIGCTQVTEIVHTKGLTLVGNLPAAFELATTYTGAVATRAAAPDLARTLLAMLTEDAAAPVRRTAGFEAC
jgi:molybdate transport system substrate-binding protein